MIAVCRFIMFLFVGAVLFNGTAISSPSSGVNPPATPPTIPGSSNSSSSGGGGWPNIPGIPGSSNSSSSGGGWPNIPGIPGSSNSSSSGGGGWPNIPGIPGSSNSSSSGGGTPNIPGLPNTSSSGGINVGSSSSSSGSGNNSESNGNGLYPPVPPIVVTIGKCGPRKGTDLGILNSAFSTKSEIIECPEVNCQQDQEFVERVTKYFEYQPSQTRGNREVLLDKQLHDYEINISGIKTRNSGYNMTAVDCNNINSDDVNEPCQDNRWRDACLVGNVPPDLDYQVYTRPLTSEESPWMGVSGAKPFFDETDQKNINCMPPKNTERLSVLSDIDNGWAFRHMCPGDPKINFAMRDTYLAKTDLFRGTQHCFAPLPKCEIQNDWLISEGFPSEWRNKKTGKFMKLLEENWVTNALGEFLGGFTGSGAPKRTLEQIFAAASPGLKDAIKKLLQPKQSRAMECKPAFWVRYAMSSCADQYIIQKSMDPNLVFNPTGRKAGLSPRFCQPLRTIALAPSEIEYDLSRYLKRTAKGLLDKDYWPYIKYNRFPISRPIANSLWKANMTLKVGTLQIKGLNMNSGGALDTLFNQYGNTTINDYLGYPVERIVDALHPFSPRYDIAEKVSGEKLTDRKLFIGQTETPMFTGKLIADALLKWAKSAEKTGEKVKRYLAVPIIPASGFWCMPKEETGYFEYANEEADCTVYCSAVNVDLLRFRYTDYRICMGCHIDANEYAFWEEVDINTDHYKKVRCGKGRWIYQESDYDDCNYAADLCGSCERSNDQCALAAAAIAVCAATGAGCDYAKKKVKKCIKYLLLCNACKYASYAEAVERARQQNNEKREPEYGPSATNLLTGNMWPVCATRFDSKLDPLSTTARDALCAKAKLDSGSCKDQALQAIKPIVEISKGNGFKGLSDDSGDPNISPLDPGKLTTAAVSCVAKTIKDICHDVAKPLASINILKTRIRKGDVRTAQPEKFETKRWKNETSTFRKKVDEEFRNTGIDAAPGLDFRYYFGNHRPYMRWWDTGKEAHQQGDRPDYWCDWGSNDTIVGVGRDWNSIHGAEAQLCRYGGGDGIGNSTGLGTCFNVQRAQRYFPHLAGTEWAELKMYQARCARREGLNCICNYETVFKHLGSEDKALSLKGGTYLEDVLIAKAQNNKDDIREQLSKLWPLGWRGYISTPITEQQFPNLFNPVNDPDFKDGIVEGGLDMAQPGDIAIWPPGIGTMPRVAVVRATHNLTSYYGNKDEIPDGERWVTIVEANHGKYPDICGNTNMLGYGPPRVIYATVEEFSRTRKGSSGPKKRLDEQIVATYYCEDSYMPTCVDRHWDQVIVWRPSAASSRTPPVQ